MRRLLLLAIPACVFATISSAQAQLLSYPDPVLYSIFPAGGSRGQTVEVNLHGIGGIAGAKQILVEGPPGVTVGTITEVNVSLLKATFEIAADAVPGRRLVRVLGGANGLTNFRYFFVDTLPSVLEKEPNNSADTPQELTLPVVVEGRVSPTLDVDVFRFELGDGEKLVAAVVAQQIDSFADRGKGYLDTSLQLRDESGNVVAAAEDSVGLDPVIEFAAPKAGKYTLHLSSLGYKGSEHAAYRLTIGDVPFPVAVFPPGGQRGTTVDVEVLGYNIPPGTRETLTVEESPENRGTGNAERGAESVELATEIASASSPVPRSEFRAPSFPVPLAETIALQSSVAGTLDVPFVRGEFPEVIETEPNDSRESAMPLSLPVTVNGRFHQAGDEDWYRVTLKAGEGVLLQTQSQRVLGAPADTHIRVFDPAGRKMAENDDGGPFGGAVQCAHDFISNDSWLAVKAAYDGDHLVQVRDLNRTAGPRSMYRLTAEPLAADIFIYQWPDAVPVWGPGTTASFVVEVLKWGGVTSDISVFVEGLPEGWSGGTAYWPKTWYSYYNGTGAIKLVVTITAPADAAVGTTVPFRVVGRAEADGRKIEREARYMTLYGSGHNDRMLVRYSPGPRAVVAQPVDCSVTTRVTEMTGKVGQTLYIPVTVTRNESAKGKQLGLVVNGPTPSAGCGWGSPITLAENQNEVEVPFSLANREPGTYALVVARSWASDLRGGRPGPCTQIVNVHVLPADGKN